MSQTAGGFGRFFKKKEQTPPRALYDDLESAHGSIAPPTASGYPSTPSRAYLPTTLRSTPQTFPSGLDVRREPPSAALGGGRLAAPGFFPASSSTSFLRAMQGISPPDKSSEANVHHPNPTHGAEIERPGTHIPVLRPKDRVHVRPTSVHGRIRDVNEDARSLEQEAFQKRNPEASLKEALANVPSGPRKTVSGNLQSHSQNHVPSTIQGYGTPVDARHAAAMRQLEARSVANASNADLSQPDMSGRLTMQDLRIYSHQNQAGAVRGSESTHNQENVSSRSPKSTREMRSGSQCGAATLDAAISGFSQPRATSDSSYRVQWARSLSSREEGPWTQLPSCRFPDPLMSMSTPELLPATAHSANTTASGQLSSNAPNSSPVPQLLPDNDTVAEIVQYYANRTQVESREHTQTQVQADDLFEDIGSYEAEREDDFQEGNYYSSQALINWEVDASDSTENSERQREGQAISANIEDDFSSHRRNPGKDTLQDLGTQNLDQFAWSPAPSDEGHSDVVEQPQSILPAPSLPSELGVEPLAFGRLSTADKENSESFDSYGNTRNLLRISSSSESIKQASSNAQSAVLPLVVNLSQAGDLHVPQPRLGSREVPDPSIVHVPGGIISDSTSSRPISQVQLQQSLSDIVKTLRAPTPSDSSSTADRQSGDRDAQESDRRLVVSGFNNTPAHATDSGPGSSQTSSSLDNDHFVSEASGRRGRTGFYNKDSGARVRSPTPPLLFGRRRMLIPDEATSSRPPLTRTNSRLARVTEAAGIRNDSRLGRAVANSSEKDWITETDVKTNAEEIGVASTEMTGSSLADNSDSGSLSPSKHSRGDQLALIRRGVIQHPAHPRYNHSYTLQKNIQTGSLAAIPDYQSGAGSRIPNVNTTTPTRLATNVEPNQGYQHPIPLRFGHPHPFKAPPPILTSIEGSPLSVKDGLPVIKEKTIVHEAVGAGTFDRPGQVENPRSPRSAHETGNELSRVREPPDGQITGVGVSKDHSQESSAWVSAVDEDESGEYSLPTRSGSFGKVTVLVGKGNITGTPEGTGAREVGSSLADASSPGAKFSSSQALPISSPPRAKSVRNRALDRHTTDGSLGSSGRIASEEFDKRFRSHRIHNRSSVYDNERNIKPHPLHHLPPHMRAYREHLKHHNLLPPDAMAPVKRSKYTSAQLNLFGFRGSSSASAAQSTPLLRSAQPSTSRMDSDDPINWADAFRKHLPPLGPVNRLRQRSPRQHRTSSESESEDNIKASLSTERASALPIPNTQKYEKRRSGGAADRGGDDLESGTRQLGDIEQQDRQRRPLDSIADTSSFRSVPILHDGIIYTDVPTPVQDHPFYGRDRPWDRQEQRNGPQNRNGRDNHGYARYRHQDNGHLPQRPEARAESPHLHPIPRRPTRETLRFEKYVSLMIAIICCIFVFMAPIFGHGYMDGVMMYVSSGRIEHFRPRDKVFVLVFGYTVFGVVIVGLPLGMILIST